THRGRDPHCAGARHQPALHRGPDAPRPTRRGRIRRDGRSPLRLRRDHRGDPRPADRGRLRRISGRPARARLHPGRKPGRRPRHCGASDFRAPARPVASAAQLGRCRPRGTDRRGAPEGGRLMVSPASALAPTAPAMRRGACPALSAPMQTGDGLLVRLATSEGGLTPARLAALCRLATRHGNGIVEVTARGSFQIRGLTLASAPLLESDVAALDLPLREGVPVETSPLAGLDPREIANPLPLARAIREAIAAAGLSAGLGPKVSVVVDGGGAIDLSDLLADVRLTAMRRDGAIAWNLAVGGTVATAKPVGVVAEEDAAAAVVAILEAIAARGRDARGR